MLARTLSVCIVIGCAHAVDDGTDGGAAPSDTGYRGYDSGKPPVSPGTMDAAVGVQSCSPMGPYGIAKGATLDPSHSWQGYAPGASSPSTVNLSDLLDCDGTKTIKALVIDSSALWCGPCQNVASIFASQVIPQSWGPNHVDVLTMVVENQSHAPAATSDAKWWLDNFHLTSDWVVADPSYTFLEAGAHQIPRLMLVDPKTFVVVDEIAGLTQAFVDEVTQFAQSH
jgi:hypothetical protein